MIKLKHLLLGTALCLWFGAGAQVTKYTFSTQADFDSKWTILGNQYTDNWSIVDNSLLWSVPSPLPSDNFPIAKYNQPLTLAEGSYYLYSNSKTDSFNDDQGFEIILSSDPTFTDASAMSIVKSGNCYNPTYKDYPVNETDRIVTLEGGKSYYLGFRGAVKSGNYTSKAGGHLYTQYIAVERIVDFPKSVTGLTVTPGATVDPEATIKWTWPTQTKSEASLTEVGAKIYRAPDGSENNIVSDEYLIKTLPVESHSVTQGSYVDNAANSGDKAPSNGKYFYAVVPYSEVGDNTDKPSTASGWLGEDVKMGLLNNIEAIFIDYATVKIKFENNNIGKGANGGYLDPAQTKYKITRTSAGGETKAIYITELEYLDTDFDRLDAYTYNVQGIYKDNEEQATNNANVKYNATNVVVAGGYINLDTPYENNFDTKDAIDIMKVTASNSSYKWQLYPTTTPEYLRFNGYGSSYSSVYSTVVTPPLMMKKGVTYKVTFNVWKGTNSSVNIKVQQGATSEALTDVENVAVSVYQSSGKPSQPQAVEVQISPAETGIQYLGFYTSFNASMTLYMDDLRIESTEVSPGVVTDVALLSAPSEENANGAVLSFAIPTLSKGGSPLTDADPAISKVTITRSYYGENYTPQTSGGNDGDDDDDDDWGYGGGYGDDDDDWGYGWDVKARANNVVSTEVFTIEATEAEPLTPGKQITFPDNTPEAGYYGYSIVAEMETGATSDAANTQVMWLGYDVPRAPFNVSTAMTPDKKGVTLSWTVSSNPATHGGYIDPAGVAYRIYRNDIEEPVAETRDTSWTDNNLMEEELPWANYTYTLYVVNKDQLSTPTETRAIVGGNVLDATELHPDFSNDADTELWDRTSWGTYQGNLRVVNAKRGDNVLYLPPFMLTDPNHLGSTVAFEAYREDSDEADYITNGEVVEVYLYDLNDNGGEPIEAFMTRGSVVFPDIYAEQLGASVNVTEARADRITHTVELIAPAPGKYRIGFKLASEENKALYIPTMDIEYGNVETLLVPAAVADLAAAPGPNGALTARVTFTMPSMSDTGRQLGELSSVTVERAASDAEEAVFETVKTFSGADCAPGQAADFDDMLPEAGYYIYKVVSSVGSAASQPAVTDAVWFGFDVPVAPAGIRAEAEGENVTVSWFPVTEGVHGGYIDTANVTYSLYRDDSVNPLASSTALSYSDTELASLPWDLYTYTVVASNGTLAGEVSEGATVVGGDVADIPELEISFSDDSAVALWDVRGWSVEDGALKAVEANGSEDVVYLPPFRAESNAMRGCTIEMSLNRENVADAAYTSQGETLQVYLVDLNKEGDDDDDSGLSRQSLGTNVMFPAVTSETLIEEINVTAADAASETVKFDLPGIGKYRIAFRCSSPDNKGLYMTSLKIALDKMNGVTLINADGMLADGMLMLPEGALGARVYTPAGVTAASCGAGETLDLRGLSSGIYVIRIEMADGTATVLKITR